MHAAFNAPHTTLMAPQQLVTRYASVKDEKRRTYAVMVDALESAGAPVGVGYIRPDFFTPSQPLHEGEKLVW